jgi:hypothetical protein
VVRRGNANRVNRAVRDQFAKVFHRLDIESVLLGGGYRPVKMWLIHVAYRNRLHFRHFHGVREVGGSHGPYADEADGNPVVGSLRAPGEERGGEHGAGCGENVAPENGLFRVHE